MTKEESIILKNTIDRGYHDRKDYPPYALAAWDDRNRYREYVFKIIDELVKEKP
jgi:hypothetical protein